MRTERKSETVRVRVIYIYKGNDVKSGECKIMSEDGTVTESGEEGNQR